MKLLPLAEDAFLVWAVCEEGGVCQVEDKLKEVEGEHPDLAEDMAALLLGSSRAQGRQ